MNADPTVDAARHMAAQASYTDTYNAALTQAERDIREGFASVGDRNILVAGMPFGTPGATNILRVAWVE